MFESHLRSTKESPISEVKGSGRKEELDSSLTLDDKVSKFRGNQDELIVFGDKESEQEESSLINSNLLKMLKNEENDVHTKETENKKSDKFIKDVISPQKDFLQKLTGKTEKELKPPLLEPIKILRPSKESATLKNLGEYHIPLKESQIHSNSKGVATMGSIKKVKKLSRQGSKESFARKKSSSSRKSRNQSKDNQTITTAENPLKFTLASVISKFPQQPLPSQPKSGHFKEDSPSSPRLKESKAMITETTSPRCNRLQTLMSKASDIKPNPFAKSFITSSPYHNEALKYGTLEVKAERSKTEFNSKLSELISEIRCNKSGSNDASGFDSDRLEAAEDTRDTPKGLEQSCNTKDFDLKSDERSGELFEKSSKPSLILDGKNHVGKGSLKEGQKIFTLSQVLSGKSQHNKL